MKTYRFIVTRDSKFEGDFDAARFAKELSRMARVGFHDDSITVVHSQAVAPGFYRDCAPLSQD